MAATQAEIQLLIDQIVTGANYRANQMNPLLSDILTAAYGPMFISASVPTVNDDETGGYRPGSVGYDTASQRFYICKNALAGAAEWLLIPSDANYEYKSYAAPDEFIGLGQNTSVFKAYNTDTVTNINCYVNLPANPYTGKVVILYFQDPMVDFNINDSDGNPITSGALLTIALGQQYTITYGGVQWEIVGVSNISPASASGVAVSKGATNIPDTTFINFIGTAVTVAAASGGGADVTINPVAGVDVQRGGSLRKAAAQFINFNSYFFDVDPNGTGADVTFVQRITVTKNTAARTTTATAFDFSGSLFDSVSSGTTATVTMNGAKTLTLTGTTVPAVTDDGIAGYSRGSVGYNNGDLLRTYICTDNTTGAAQWKLITDDNGYESPALIGTSGYIISTLPSTANVAFAPVAPLAFVRINLPANAYLGKKVFISFQSNVTPNGADFRNGSNIFQFNATISGASASTPKMIIAVCVNESTQSWVRLQ